MKNIRSRGVRQRTSGANRPETPDRRVRRTKRSLHEALIGLAREKPYDAIAVKEIIERADVGRSTFYMHFRDKDELLRSGIDELLRPAAGDAGADSVVDRLLAFSLPLLEHIARHRSGGGPAMGHTSRVMLHQHLEETLAGRISEQLERVRRPAQMAPNLIARHVAATFVLMLNWWVEHEPALTPADVDARFRALVLPALAR